MSWSIVYTKQAVKDSKKIESSNLKPKVVKLIAPLKNDPYTNTLPIENLIGDLSGAYSRRINIHHRLVYQMLDDIKTVKIIRMWTHYE